MSGGIRASTIPSNVRKMIQNIKEITGNYTDDEIYAMLKECSMDPNETAQKLLLQDTFHKVKRRRDRRKESEASAVWIPAPGRDVSSLPANSFYNLSPPPQHMTFAATQAIQGTFNGIYHHPAPAVTAATTHPLLQQSQAILGPVDKQLAFINNLSMHKQNNWPSNY